MDDEDFLALLDQRAAELKGIKESPTIYAMRGIMKERDRQILEEGFSPNRDDGYRDGELALAAAAYAMSAAQGWSPVTGTFMFPHAHRYIWPSGWASSWFKPKSRREDLIKAGALILAEIERIDRAEAKRQMSGTVE